jgi:acetoin utilization deacetylase AcuC-like enzyme
MGFCYINNAAVAARAAQQQAGARRVLVLGACSKQRACAW